MVIFNSYVKLPEGSLVVDNPKTYTQMIYRFRILYSIWSLEGE